MYIEKFQNSDNFIIEENEWVNHWSSILYNTIFFLGIDNAGRNSCALL